jgi:hypothetical protein
MLNFELIEEFWSDVYRGRPIAVLNRGGRWHVYLDHILQHNLVFATPEHGMRWLRTRVDKASLSAAEKPATNEALYVAA